MKRYPQDDIQKTTLPNGLRIVTETIDSVRSLSCGVWVKTGSRHETDRQAGITHFLEHMLFKGTENRSAFDIVQTMESVGGFLNAFTSLEHTCYYSRCLDSEKERAIDVLSDMVLRSTFPPEEIEKEKKVIIEEMKMYRDSPEDYIFEIFNGLMFENHPLGRPILGYEHTVNSFAQDALSAYLAQRYNPANTVLSVAGNVTHQEIVDLALRYFTVDSSPYVPVEDLPLSTFVKQHKRVSRAIEQTHLVLGRRSLGINHPNRYELLLANTLLSGGMSSRLNQNIREKYGYCYSVSSFNQAYHDTGLFGVYAGTDESYAEHVQELIYQELGRLGSEIVPEKELMEAKSQLKGKLLLGQENMSNRMTRLAKSELYFDRYISLDELVEHIDAVTSEEIRNFAVDFFNPEFFTETILVPES
ncbi:MAG: insulinase family protein [Candidatus Cyclonatronum sp.]|uniref:M16 family metallopeptidase n=1 Tax=Cyclonatronum sp. TaxID=3024185 RepID=UPI0025B7A97D|nr:pitrilysin family protein [Cyclonatronum sp.]MCC5933066.1 insulinase family protein [Balneolales bacterium]MCH8485739.1 insulinase family protein [Cyclonatronum sp.]